MIPVAVDRLRSGDVIAFTPTSRLAYTVTGLASARSGERLVYLSFKERPEVCVPATSGVYALTMVRQVKVPCLLHRDMVTLLCDLAKGRAPRAVLCEQASQAVTVAAMKWMRESACTET